jgi:hypothetical protein
MGVMYGVGMLPVDAMGGNLKDASMRAAMVRFLAGLIWQCCMAGAFLREKRSCDEPVPAQNQNFSEHTLYKQSMYTAKTYMT